MTTFDKLPDHELVAVILRNVWIDEFDLSLEKIGHVTVNMKRLRKELKLALSRYDTSDRHPQAGRFQEL